MIRMRDIAVVYNRGSPMETHALRGLDLEIPAGQFVTVIGSNGAGKSTLLNVLTGDAAIDTRTLAGRRRLGVTRFTEKLNTPVQGTGADGLKLALALLWEPRDQLPGAFPVLAVHDEIVVEADEEEADTAAAWLKAAMVDAMAPLIAPVPVEVEVQVARTWAGG